jgi:hypothetical protein
MNSSFLCFDACRLAHRRDALLSWRALFERSELVRPPQVWRPSAQMSQTGRPWFWGLLPEQKGLVCRGETRQHRTSRRHESGGHTWNAFTCQHVLGTTPKRDSRYTSSSCKAKTIRPIFYMSHLFSIFVPTSPIPCQIVAYKLQLNLWRADSKNFAFLSLKRVGNHSVNGSHPSMTARLVQRSECAWIESVWATLGTATEWAKVCRNCVSITVPDIVSILDKTVRRSCCSSVGVTKARKPRISKTRNDIGTNTGGDHEKE